MQTKICSVCKKELPANSDYFYKNANGKFGLYSKCKKCHALATKKYYQENEAFYLDYRKEYSSHEENKKRVARLRDKWIENNRDYRNDCARQWNQQRKAKLRGVKATLTSKEWRFIKEYFENKCCYCGQKKPLTQDHFIPLFNGGEYTIGNVVPACALCNSMKNNKDFFEWYPRQNFFSEKRKYKIVEFISTYQTAAKGGETSGNA